MTLSQLRQLTAWELESPKESLLTSPSLGRKTQNRADLLGFIGHLYLHGMSPRGLSSMRLPGRWTSHQSTLSSLKVWIAFYNLISEVTRGHFCHVTLPEAVTGLTQV